MRRVNPVPLLVGAFLRFQERFRGRVGTSSCLPLRAPKPRVSRGFVLVGAAGFEPATSRVRGRSLPVRKRTDRLQRARITVYRGGFSYGHVGLPMTAFETRN